MGKPSSFLNRQTVGIKPSRMIAVLLLLVFWTGLLAGCSSADSEAVSSSGLSSGESGADQALESLFTEDSFASLSTDQAVEKVGALLETLVEEGDIEAGYSFDETAHVYSFLYADGSHGSVMLEPYDGETLSAGADGGNAASFLLHEGTEAADAASVLVLDAVQDNNAYQKPIQSLCDTLTEKGAVTEIRKNVTPDTLCDFGGADIVIFYIHGSYYDGQSHLALNCETGLSTDWAYRQDLKSGAMVKTWCNVGSKNRPEYKQQYHVTEGFFKNHCAAGSLNGVLAVALSCQFFGCDCSISEPNYDLGNRLISLGADAVLGFKNNIPVNYGFDIATSFLTGIFDGENAGDAFSAALTEKGSEGPVSSSAEEGFCRRFAAKPLLLEDHDGGSYVLREDGGNTTDVTALLPAFGAYYTLLSSGRWMSDNPGWNTGDSSLDLEGCYSLADLDGDGSYELIVYAWQSMADSFAMVYRYNGKAAELCEILPVTACGVFGFCQDIKALYFAGYHGGVSTARAVLFDRPGCKAGTDREVLNENGDQIAPASVDLCFQGSYIRPYAYELKSFDWLLSETMPQPGTEMTFDPPANHADSAAVGEDTNWFIPIGLNQCHLFDLDGNGTKEELSIIGTDSMGGGVYDRLEIIIDGVSCGEFIGCCFDSSTAYLCNLKDGDGTLQIAAQDDGPGFGNQMTFFFDYASGTVSHIEGYIIINGENVGFPDGDGVISIHNDFTNSDKVYSFENGMLR